MKKTFGEMIKDSISKVEIDNTIPLFDFHIFGVGFYINRKPELYFEICETFPYAPDGEVPLIFINVAWFEIIFESKWLYKKVYDRRYGVDLEF